MLRNLLTAITLISIFSPLGGCQHKPNSNLAATGIISLGDISLEAKEYRTKRFQPIDENKKGRALLADFQETAQFDDFPQGAKEELAKMKESYELVLRHSQ